MHLVVPFGTRPEIVKLAPVVAALRGAAHDVTAVATGQHDDPMLAERFFADLGLEPDVRWTLPQAEGARVGAILEHAYATLESTRPEAVMLLGDTHTVPLFALAARRFQIPVVHLEAGLRSFNDQSLEEVNRKAVGAIASLHLAPTDLAARFLAAEGVEARRVHVVGNPVTDSLRRLGPPRTPVAERVGVVVTAHRATNVDDPRRLGELIDLVERLGAEAGPVCFPLHPRTRSRLEAAGQLERLVGFDGVQASDPLPYPAMLGAIAGSQVVITDSGGLQEEAAWLGVPCVVLRTSTPRWEGVLAGIARLVGLDAAAAAAAVADLRRPEHQVRADQVLCPYGDGHVAERVTALLGDAAIGEVLALREPDLGELTQRLGPMRGR